MPIFEYKALQSSGKAEKGLIEAENVKAARTKLKKKGLIVTSIGEKNARTKGGARSGGSSLFAGRVSYQEISLMTRQLASLVKANIPLVEALNALVDQTDNDRLKVIISQVRQDVNEGSSLAKAMAPHPKIFDNIFVNMVEAGESSGTLSLVLVKLADLKAAQVRLRGKVISGMTYPVLMMIVAAVLMLVIFSFVIPKLTKVFKSMNKPVPTITKVLMDISDVVNAYWYLIVGGSIFGLISFLRYINTEKGRQKWDGFKLRMPMFGSLFRMVAVTRFASTMGTLLSSGVPILTAMKISKNLVGNVLIAEAVENARENITEGQSIADPLRRSGEFPPLVTHMISIGEKTGELPDMLRNISETYEEQVNAKIEGMTAALEPLMIIFMGGMVGFIVLSIFIPLLDISNIQSR
ncbi:MAG: type II secretion system inner membrane protein GspF [Bacteriovoracia bacterium]